MATIQKMAEGFLDTKPTFIICPFAPYAAVRFCGQCVDGWVKDKLLAIKRQFKNIEKRPFGSNTLFYSTLV